MSNAIGGTVLFNIVIVFILLFTGIMTITINRSRAYAVKDEIISAIESNGGLDVDLNLADSEVGEEIVEIMNNNSYRSIGTCEDNDPDLNGVIENEDGTFVMQNEYRGFDRDGELTSTEPSICIKRLSYSEASGNEDSVGCYYHIELFYQLDFPILKEVFNFSVKGETKLVSGAACDGGF